MCQRHRPSMAPPKSLAGIRTKSASFGHIWPGSTDVLATSTESGRARPRPRALDGRRRPTSSVVWAPSGVQLWGSSTKGGSGRQEDRPDIQRRVAQKLAPESPAELGHVQTSFPPAHQLMRGGAECQGSERDLNIGSTGACNTPLLIQLRALCVTKADSGAN